MDDKRHGRNHVATRRRGEEVIMSLTIYRFHHGFLRGKQTLYTSFSRTRGEERLAPPTQCTYSKSIPFERYGALRRMMNETNFVERAARQILSNARRGDAGGRVRNFVILLATVTRTAIPLTCRIHAWERFLQQHNDTVTC